MLDNPNNKKPGASAPVSAPAAPNTYPPAAPFAPKFNPYHDPHNGQFTTGPHVGDDDEDDGGDDDQPTATPVSYNPSASDSWSDPSTLQRYFNKHGKDFNAQSPEDYADQAHQFYERFQSEKLPAIENTDGYIKTYEPSTNTFGVYDPEGNTINFFKPTSPSYFEREIENTLKDGGRIINPLPSSGTGGSEGGGGIDIFHPQNPWENIEE